MEQEGDKRHAEVTASMDESSHWSWKIGVGKLEGMSWKMGAGGWKVGRSQSR